MDTYYNAINDFIIMATNGAFDLRKLVVDYDHIIAMYYHGNTARQAAGRLLAENHITIVAL